MRCDECNRTLEGIERGQQLYKDETDAGSDRIEQSDQQAFREQLMDDDPGKQVDQDHPVKEGEDSDIYTYRTPVVCGEPDSDDEEDKPEDQVHWKEDAIGRFYKVDSRGNRLLKLKRNRRFETGFDTPDWTAMTPKQKQLALDEAKRRKADGSGVSSSVPLDPASGESVVSSSASPGIEIDAMLVALAAYVAPVHLQLNEDDYVPTDPLAFEPELDHPGWKRHRPPSACFSSSCTRWLPVASIDPR